METYEYKTIHVPANKRKQTAELNKYGAQGWELVGPVRLMFGAGQGTATVRRPKQAKAPKPHDPVAAAAGGFFGRVMARMEADNQRNAAARAAAKLERKTGTR